jgi:hypothetical protein
MTTTSAMKSRLPGIRIRHITPPPLQRLSRRLGTPTCVIQENKAGNEKM